MRPTVTTLTLTALQHELSTLFRFDVELDKSLNIDYRMDGEEVLDGIYNVATKYDIDLDKLARTFRYSLYFKQGLIAPVVTHLSRFLNLPHDGDLFVEAPPLRLTDILEVLIQCSPDPPAARGQFTDGSRNYDN